MAATIRVLVVDDHPLVRDSVTGFLNDTDGITVVGEAANGRRALELASALHPDVVLMDVTMPTMSGLEAAAVLSILVRAIRTVHEGGSSWPTRPGATALTPPSATSP